MRFRYDKATGQLVEKLPPEPKPAIEPLPYQDPSPEMAELIARIERWYRDSYEAICRRRR